EVDWVLDRLGQELDLLRGQLAAVRAAHGLDDDTDDAEQSAEGGAHALPSDKDDARPSTTTAASGADGSTKHVWPQTISSSTGTITTSSGVALCATPRRCSNGSASRRSRAACHG